MNHLKKTTLAVFLASSSTAFAGTMGPVCTAGNVTVPCDTNAWSFGVEALYMKPILGVGEGYLHNGRVSANQLTANEYKLDWGWGFKLEGSYYFNTGNDLTLNWYHLMSNSNQTLIATFNSYTVDEVNVQYALQTNLKWDAVNAEFGQHVDFGGLKNIRVHAGAQYANLQNNTSVNDIVFSVPPVTASGPETDSYSGIGPRIGVDLTYSFANGLSVYGNGATALLVGKSKYRYSTTDIDGTFVYNGSKTAIVPEVDAKLGVQYAYTMSQGHLTLDAGYMVAQYFETFGYFIDTLKRQSDLGFNGPYFGLKWLGNL